jgi:hypothetical protein
MKQIEALESSNGIYQKLEAFIRKYYTNELIRGIVLFIGLGFSVHAFRGIFSLAQTNGKVYFVLDFCWVEVVLLFRFILFPIFKLFKFQKESIMTRLQKL